MSPAGAPERLDGALPPALVASPRAPDSTVLVRALAECGIPAEVLGADLGAHADGIGCLVLTQEMLTAEFRDAVGDHLDAQPAWSELPIVVVLESRDRGIAWRDVLLGRWARANVTFLVRPLGGLEFQSAVQQAISARLRQLRIRDQLDRERELRHELNHRVKNIFATVQGIAAITRRTADQGDPFATFEERLAALGRVHGALDRVANEGETFDSLTRTVLAPYLSDRKDRFEITGPDTALDPSACNVLGLCLFELATNAMKHGALSGDAGRVAISLTEDRGTVRFDWTERGGPAVRPPDRKGYGSRFLTMTITSLFEAPPVFDYGSDGFRLTVEGEPDGLFAGRILA